MSGVERVAGRHPSWTRIWDVWLERASEAQSRRKVQAELRGVDQHVKTHERVHLAAAGVHAAGSAQYTYATGPGGERYAVGGSVKVDLAPVPGDPEATLRKADALMRAAMSPGDPSAADMRVAAAAYRMAAAAKREISAGEGETGLVIDTLA